MLSISLFFVSMLSISLFFVSLCFVILTLSLYFVQEFDWDSAVKEIDEATAISNRPSSSHFASTSHSNQQIKEAHKYPFASSSSRQSTLDKFIQNSTKNAEKSSREQENRNGFGARNGNEGESYGPSYVEIDPEAAKTWIFPGSFFHCFFFTSNNLFYILMFYRSKNVRSYVLFSLCFIDSSFELMQMSQII